MGSCPVHVLLVHKEEGHMFALTVFSDIIPTTNSFSCYFPASWKNQIPVVSKLPGLRNFVLAT